MVEAPIYYEKLVTPTQWTVLKEAIPLMLRFKKTFFMDQRLDQGIAELLSEEDQRVLAEVLYEKSGNKVIRGWACGIALYARLHNIPVDSFHLAVISVSTLIANKADAIADTAHLESMDLLKNLIYSDQEIARYLSIFTKLLYQAKVKNYIDEDTYTKLVLATKDFFELALKGMVQAETVHRIPQYHKQDEFLYRLVTNLPLIDWQLTVAGLDTKDPARSEVILRCFYASQLLQMMDDMTDVVADVEEKKVNSMVAYARETGELEKLLSKKPFSLKNAPKAYIEFCQEGNRILRKLGIKFAFPRLIKVWGFLTK